MTISTLEWYIRSGCPERGLPDGNLTYCFRETSKYGFAVQQSELCWTSPQSGKITYIPNRPLLRQNDSEIKWHGSIARWGGLSSYPYPLSIILNKMDSERLYSIVFQMRGGWLPCTTSDKPAYVAHGLALLHEIRTWCVVREGWCSKKKIVFYYAFNV